MLGCTCTATQLLSRKSAATVTPTKTPKPTFTPTTTATATPIPTDTSTPTPTSTFTPLPTDTPVPTETPTNTPEPPTNTPKPTRKPTARPAPTATKKPAPVNTPKPSFEWSGQVTQGFQNCGLTQVYGFVLDRNGGLAGDIWVRYWTDGWEGAWAKSSWVTDEGDKNNATDDKNWDGTIDVRPRDGTWYVCIAPEQGSKQCLSNTVNAVTSSNCQTGNQSVYITFRKN
jgi:hypothetical protein